MPTPFQLIEQLYREMAPSLLGYFRRQGLRACGEDLLQDTFVRALRQVERLPKAASPRAYVFGIARFLSIDALRRPRLAPVEAAAPEHTENPSAADDRIESLRQAIDQLPGIHREPLVLKLRHELSYQEIADVLGLPVGTVRSRLHQAMRLLKASMAVADIASPAQPAKPSQP